MNISTSEIANLLDGNGRPSWDSWFMTLCFVVAQRSLDKHTKHGCVIIDDSRTVLSVGYNGPPRGCDDSQVPLERPSKYFWMEHSESNAIVNAARSGTPLKDSIFYITGPPCYACFRQIMNLGAKEVVTGPITHKRTEEEFNVVREMAAQSNVVWRAVNDVSSVLRLLLTTTDYINTKIEEQDHA